MPEPTAPEFLTKRYHQNVDVMVRRLRDVADQMERDGHRTENHVGSPPYSWAAHSVVHAVTWGVANLGLDNLTLLAAEIDAFRSGPPTVDASQGESAHTPEGGRSDA